MRPTTLTRLLRPWLLSPTMVPSNASFRSLLSVLNHLPPLRFPSPNPPLGSKTQAPGRKFQAGAGKCSAGTDGIGAQEGGEATGPRTTGTATTEPLSIPIPREAEEPKKSLSESYKSLPSRTRTAFWLMFGLFALTGQQLLDMYVESQGGKGEVEVIDEGEAVVLRIKEGKKPEAEHHSD